MTEQPQQDQVDILETRNINARIPLSVYNVFVPKENMKSEMSISLSNINSIQFASPQNVSAGGISEDYDLPLTFNSVYSRCFIRHIVPQIQIKGSKTYVNNYPTLSTGVGDVLLLCCNSNFYQPPFFGFRCDPLSCSVSSSAVSYGTNNINVSNSYTPATVNNMRRLADPKLYEEYSGLLRPETYNANHKLGHVSSFPNFHGLRIDASNGSSDGATYKYQCLDNTFADLEQEELNMLSYRNRGAIFKDAVYTFSKQIASPNWTWDNNAKKFIATPNSTQLYTMKVGLFVAPTNVSNWKTALDTGVGFATLVWGCNKQYFNGTNYQPQPVPNPPVSVYEDPNQLLDTVIDFPNGISSPILNNLLEDLPTSSTSQCSSMKITLQLQSNLFQNMTVNRLWNSIIQPINGGHPYQQLLGTGSLTILSRKVYYSQYDLSYLTPSIKPMITLPYLMHNIYTSQYTLPELSWTSLTSGENITYYGPPITFTQSIDVSTAMPSYFKFFVDTLDGSDVPYKILDVKCSINGKPNTLLQNVGTLFQASRANGLHLRMQDENNAYTTLNTERALCTIPASVPALYLSFGTNIPLDGLVAGQEKPNVRLQFEVTCDFNFPNATSLYGYSPAGGKPLFPKFIMISESLYMIQSNSVSTTSELFTAADYSSVLKLTTDAINRNQYSVKKNTLYGSGAPDIAHYKKQHIIPKLRHNIKPSGGSDIMLDSENKTARGGNKAKINSFTDILNR